MENFDKKIKEKLLSYPSEELPSEMELMKMMDMLDEALPAEKPIVPINSKTKANVSFKIFYKVAASIAFFALAFYGVFLSNNVTIEASGLAVESVQLPDGSQVKMKEGSSVKYNKLIWLFDRSVTFEGEGYFEIEKGEKFILHSELGSTEILGTSFTITSNKIKYEVSCLTGKVLVTSTFTGEDAVLLPGDAVLLNKEVFEPFKLKTLMEPSWVSGEFYFEEENFEYVISILKEQFGVEVSYPKEVEGLKYTGYFDNNDLEKALKLVCEPLELAYKINGDKILLSEMN